MKYYPKLKIFKNSSATNTFDGFEARSYEWYVYAYVIDNVVYEVEKSYSPTTSGHISTFSSIVGHDMPRIYILAPNGLNNRDSARKEILEAIETLNEELANKRNRKRQERMDRIEILKLQLTHLDQLETLLANRKAA